MDAGEPEFQNIYTTYQPKVLRHMQRMVGECEAEDLTQEVFVKVNQGLKSFRGEAQLSTWIYRIATNTALDRLRSPSYQRSVQDCFLPLPSGEVELEIDDQNPGRVRGFPWWSHRSIAKR